MAIGAPPDPIPALHGLFGLLEFEEIDAFDRNVLGWQRDQMLAVRNAPSGAAWLRWYRDLLQAVMQISARWQAAKESSAPVVRPQIAPQQLAAVGRLREQPGIFSQRWGVRLQDQAATAKHRVLSRLDAISTRASETQTHVTFFVPDDQLAALRRDVLAELNAWAAHAETAIAASWMETVRDAVRSEGLASGATPPPAWSVRLSVADLPPLRPDTTSARRPGFFATFLRETRTLAMPFAPPLAAAVAWLSAESDKKTVSAAVVGTIVMLLIAPAVAIWLVRKMAEERAQLEHDHRTRLLNQIESWAATTVDGFRVRMAGLLAPSSAEMRGKFAEWLDAGWGRAADSPAAPTPAAGRGPDMGPWMLTLSSARSAIATRIAQLELELSTSSNAAPAKP